MPTATMDPIAQAKNDITQATDRLKTLLAKTPDDKLNWSPSPTARTPIQQVVHCAMAIQGIHGMLEGRNTFDFSDLAAADRQMREEEKKYTTRQQALDLLDANTSAYLAYLDTIPANKLETMVETPFGMSMPLAGCFVFAPMHTRGHVGQLEYIQTCYGDHDWYFGG